MALSAGAVSALTSRVAKKLHHFVTNIASILGAPATGDVLVVFDASDNYEPKYSPLSTVLSTAPAAQLFTQAAPAAKTTSTTLTAAELTGGLITGNQGAAGAAAYTLPLATAMETALVASYPSLANDNAFDFSVINISTVAAETITMTTNTGWTLVGDMVLAANATGDESVGTFRVRRTAANTYTLYRVA